MYYIHAPSPAHRLEAAFIYSEALYDCSFQGVLTDEEMLQVMIDNDLWSMDEEAELNSAPLRVDALKVEMYQRFAAFKSSRVEQARRMLKRLRIRQSVLARRRHAYDLYTQKGLAGTFKLQYLIAKNVKGVDADVIDLESQPEWILRRVVEEYMHGRPTERDLRHLSKYSAWRMIWASGRQEGRVFGVPSTWLTDEQQNLIAWSKLQDNIQEHPEPPPKEVLEDDDMLDGWIIVEQKKREKEQRERAGDDKSRKSGAQEMFIPADSKEDAKRIESMNESSAAFVKRQRMATLKQHKVVGEQHMPDSKQQISTQAAQQFRDKMRQTRR